MKKLPRFFLIAALPALAGAVGLASSVASRQAANADSYRLGAYDPHGTFGANARVSIEHIFMPWKDVRLESLYSADKYASARDRSLIVTVEPWSWTTGGSETSSDALHRDIVAGKYDRNIRALCRTVNALSSPVTLRWGHEMDLGNGRYPWSGWSGPQYVAAYRHFVDTCRPLAKSTKFMWSPRGEAKLASFYPGKAYVDSIGLSLFAHQKYEVDTFGHALSFGERFGSAYTRVAGYDTDIFIVEFGCHGDDDYVRRCWNEVQVKDPRFPRLAGVIYFNDVESFPWPSPYGLPDWRMRDDRVARLWRR